MKSPGSFPTQTRMARNAAVSSILLFVLLTPLAYMHGQQGKPVLPNLAGFPDPGGVVRTFDQNGDLDLTGPFFQSLGTNGRSCATCHQPSDAMTVSAAHVQGRFDASQGLDPIFRTNDGSNCDHDINVSTLEGRSAAYSLLRTRGLIRVALAVPDGADYLITGVSNPYRCSEAGIISIYRRPLPGANLKFLTTVMWDGRESSLQTGTTPIDSASYPGSLLTDLAHQATDATLGHAQALNAPTAAQLQSIVAVETGLFSAQAEANGAGNLGSGGAGGGPQAVSQQPFFVGINDPVGLDPTNPVPFTFNTKIFNLFDEWEKTGSPQHRAIARGQALFNTRTFTITGVAGLNGATFPNRVTAPNTIVSTCGICHDSPNAGNHSVSAPLNIGVADPPHGANILDTSYLPLITICQRSGPACVTTTDPGRALISGKFSDVGKFKGPVLRGLAARAPYFHNGSAQSLLDVVNFYDSRFSIGFTAQEKADLVAFLSSL